MNRFLKKAEHVCGKDVQVKRSGSWGLNISREYLNISNSKAEQVQGKDEQGKGAKAEQVQRKDEQVLKKFEDNC